MLILSKQKYYTTQYDIKVTPSMAYPTFSHIRTQAIASLNLSISEYVHKITKTQHFHISAPNPENVFLVAFRTLPSDSTGVAHILEHTALCGSKKYPVRDPFFMMLRRSLNTFMNAFTSSDWTAYPFASQNQKDFFNLLSVYLDASFFSRLHPLDFAQEGHRLEFSEPKQATSDLVYKGVVFNEMKGAMSSPTSLLYDRLNYHLFPTSTYHYNSGGEPSHIPDLSYDALIKFYKKHYHPSNAIFMTYGDIDADVLQEHFEKEVLSQFQHSNEIIQVLPEKRYLAPIKVEEYYGLDAEGSLENTLEKKTYHLFGWLFGESTDLNQKLEANLLAQVLLDNSASPLRKALETYPHASAPSSLSGLEDQQREMTFICGVEGSDPQHAHDIEQTILSVFDQISKQGIAPDVLESVCHQLELSQREIGGDGFPYGLQLILSALPASIHRGDPIQLLDLDPALETLRKNIQSPDYIKQLAQKLLLENTHRVSLTVKPDAKLNERMRQTEINKLKQIQSRLSNKEKQAIIETAETLKTRQTHKDDESILPKVTIKDVPNSITIPQPEKAPNLNKPGITWYKAGTNGLSYVQCLIPLPALTSELIQILPEFNLCLTEVGVGSKDYLSMQKEQAKVTGGIFAHNDIRADLHDQTQHKGLFCLSGKALNRNAKAMIELLKETLYSVQFTEHARIRELISQRRASKEQSVTGQGHSLAMNAAASSYSPMMNLQYNLSGLKGIQALKQLDDNLSQAESLEKLIEQFKQVHTALLGGEQSQLIVSDQSDIESLIPLLNWQNQTTHHNTTEAFSYLHQNKVESACWITNTQVNFCAKAYPTVPAAHADAAPLSVLSRFLRNGYLHRAIREEGGAYGGGASYDRSNGVFSFYSYRDPRLLETLSDFDNAIHWLKQEKHKEESLEQAILGLIGDLDKPGSPAGEAKQAYHNDLHGRTAEIINAYRQKVLSVTLEDLMRVAHLYLEDKDNTSAVITSQAGWQTIEKQTSFTPYEL